MYYNVYLRPKIIRNPKIILRILLQWWTRDGVLARKQNKVFPLIHSFHIKLLPPCHHFCTVAMSFLIPYLPPNIHSPYSDHGELLKMQIRSDNSLAYSQWLPAILKLKLILMKAYQTSHDLPAPLTFAYSSLSTLAFLLILKTKACVHLFCTCCSLWLEHSSLEFDMVHSLISFRTLFIYYLPLPPHLSSFLYH